MLDIDGAMCFEPDKVANHINEFYTTIASRRVDKLLPSTNKYGTDSKLFRDYYKKLGVSPNSLILTPVTREFVFKELDNLDVNKSTGPDGIPARFLKDGASIIADPITNIVNFSILSNVVPDDMKIARVRPLFKKNSRTDVGNYRPVSILNITSKILERAVHVQVESYLQENNLLYKYQSGFRKSHSTDTSLIHLTDHIRTEIFKGNYTGMVLLDLQKAFDTVNHNILCQKLTAMGIGSSAWFRSYLSNRRQTVSVNDVESGPLKISCGVPQGSILGPLLFLCYINDMPISVNCKLSLYADDSALLVSGKNATEIASALSSNLGSSREWLIDNKLSLHLGKTECILFGTKQKLNRISDFEVKCNNVVVESSKSVKYLGVYLNNVLSGDEIAQNVIKKTSARLKFFYRHRHSLNEKSRKTLCSALIQCHFDYACSSWYSALSQALKNKLQIMQNKVVRFVLNLDPRSHIGQRELDQLKMLYVKDRVIQLKMNHVFNISNGLSNSYLGSNFNHFSSIHHYNTRNSELNFILPKAKSQACKTFYFTAIQDWNSLSTDIKSIRNKQSFKSAIRSYLSLSNMKKEDKQNILV